MRKLARIFALGGVVASAALCLAEPALGADSITCQYAGLAGALVPPVPAVTHDPGLAGSIETGTYHIAGNATCVKVDADPGQSANSGVFDLDFFSNGRYANGVCGVTDWFQTANLIDTQFTSSDPRWEGPLELVYIIRFVGSQGAMQIFSAALPGDPVVTRSGSSGVGAGYASIIPTNGGDCISNDAAYFQVTGVFTVAV